MQEFAINNAQKFVVGSFVPSVKDKDGAGFKNPDGTDVTPDQVSQNWETDGATDASSNVILVLNKDASGHLLEVASGTPGAAGLGRSEVSVTLGYPDGSSKVTKYGFTVGHSEPGEPEFTGTVVDEA